jgi:hypothetical protein
MRQPVLVNAGQVLGHDDTALGECHFSKERHLTKNVI